MAGHIPEDKIDEVRNSVDIVDIVSEAVDLKRTGKNHQGLCPFHSEDTPSFNVSPDRQTFYCFGCNETGNVFSFLMKHRGMSFPEAVRSLARRAGIDLPEGDLSPEMKRRLEEKERLFALNKAASGFFRKSLLGSAGRGAREYLEKRGFSDETAEAFQLGFAPRGWDNLAKFLADSGFSLEEAEKAGLVASRPSGNGFYDLFRERIVFPIANPRNRIEGFGGRVMDDSHPKYLNSKQSAVFDKSRTLYGLNLTKAECRRAKRVFVVEGYMDLIALYQHGIKNAVAPLGTSLTSEHVRMLGGLAQTAILVFDSDKAGEKAAMRAIPLFRKSQLELRIMRLPEGHDPDSFVFRFGSEAFSEAAEEAPGAIPFLSQEAVARHGLSLEGKLAVVKEMKKPLRDVEDPVARSLYIKDLSEKTGVEAEIIEESLRESRAEEPAAWRGEPPPMDCFEGIPEASGSVAPDCMGHPSSPGPSRRRGREGRARGEASKSEKKIVAMMLHCPEMLADIVTYDVLDYFENEDLKAVARAVLYCHDGDCAERLEPSDLSPWLEGEFQEQLAVSLARDDEDYWMESEGRKRQLIVQFVDFGMSRREKELWEKIRVAEKEGDMDLLSELMTRRQNMAFAKRDRKMALLTGA